MLRNPTEVAIIWLHHGSFTFLVMVNNLGSRYFRFQLPKPQAEQVRRYQHGELFGEKAARHKQITSGLQESNIST